MTTLTVQSTILSVRWSHPRFGPILAVASYDGQLTLFKETTQNQWNVLYTYNAKMSITSISFFPETYGLKIAFGTMNGTIGILEYIESTKTFNGKMENI